MRGSQLKNIETYPSGQQNCHPFKLSEKLRDTCFPAVRLSSNGNMGRKLKQFELAFHQFCGQLAISEQFLLHNEAIGKLLHV